MKKSIDYAFDDHPSGAEKARTSWALAIADDCEDCDDLRVELTVEEEGGHGAGIIAHLSPASARRLRSALGAGLKDLGEEPG